MKTDLYYLMAHVRRLQRELNAEGYKRVRGVDAYILQGRGEHDTYGCNGCGTNLVGQLALLFACDYNVRRFEDHVEFGYGLEWWYCYDQAACLERRKARA